MKSVHITNYYHRDSGGISTAYNKLLEAANRHERHVRLIVPGAGSSVEAVGKFGKIYFVKAGYSPVFDKRYRLMLPWKAYIPDKAPVKAILRDEKPDMIEVGEKYSLSLMAGLLRKGVMNVAERRPMLVHLSCERMDDNVSSFISGGKLAMGFTRWYMANYIAPMFDFHLTNSDYTASEISDAFGSESSRGFVSKSLWQMLRAPKIPLKDRVFVNQCGVDIDRFRSDRRDGTIRQKIFESLGFPAEAKVLLYAGRISPEKNVGLLTEMMKAIIADSGRDIRLVVAGDGPLREKLEERLTRAAPGRVALLGNVTDRELLADLFANADVFVHPNPREPFGITPLEAMASGTPLVAPHSGGVLSYADGTNALLVEATGRAFADAVRSTLDDPAAASSRTARALSTARRYSWKASTDSLFSLYDRMFAEFNTRRELFDYQTSTRGSNLADELPSSIADGGVTS